MRHRRLVRRLPHRHGKKYCPTGYLDPRTRRLIPQEESMGFQLDVQKNVSRHVVPTPLLLLSRLTAGSRLCEVPSLMQLTLPSTREYERKSLHGNRNHQLQSGFEASSSYSFSLALSPVISPSAVTVGGAGDLSEGCRGFGGRGGGYREGSELLKVYFLFGSPFIKHYFGNAI